MCQTFQVLQLLGKNNIIYRTLNTMFNELKTNFVFAPMPFRSQPWIQTEQNLLLEQILLEQPN